MSPRNLTLLGFPNVISAADSLISPAASAPAGFEASYLKTEEPSDTARVLSIDPLTSYWEVDFTSSSRDFYGLATANSNLSPWGYYRYWNSNGSGGFYTALTTTGIAASTNATGVYTNVDEAISSPDGLFMSPTVTTSDWSVRLNFSTPSASPKIGLAKGLIVINVILVGVPLTKYPRVTVDLYQADALIQTLGYRAITRSSSIQTFIFDFNPSILTNSSGSGMSALISFQPGGEGTYGKLDTTRCYVINSSATKDSGFIQSTANQNASRELIVPPSVSYHYFPVDPWLNLTHILYSVVDDQVEHNPSMGTSVSGIPINNVRKTQDNGYIEAGVLVGGGVLTFTPGLTKADPGSIGLNVLGVSGFTIGGQSYGANSWKRRRTGPLTVYCNRTEADLFMYYVPWSKGNAGAFYLSMDPDINVLYQEFQSFWGILLGSVERSEVNYFPNEEALFSLKCEFEEKL